MTHQRRLLYFFLMVFSLTGLQCKSTRFRKQAKAVYEDQFRLTYFRQLLTKGYHHSNAVKELLELDHSGFTEPILTPDDYRIIDSLTTIDQMKMEADSAGTVGKVAEGAEGKHTLAFILNKMNSRWLDDLVKKRYRRSGAKDTFR